MLRRFFGFSIILAGALGCSRDDTASARTRDGARSPDDGVAPRPSLIAAASQPYKVVAVTGGGAITGTVDIEGSAPLPAIIRPTADQNVCGNSIVEKNLALAGTRIGGAIVWLSDIRSGKAFPLERRFELANSNCIFDPYVQAISTGSTLNVSNDDRVLHTNRFINVGTGELAGIAPFNDDGEVVPLDRFKDAAQIEVVSDRHPWAHAWIAVLDHPYYTQTAPNGTFTIDGIPPGKYLVRAWHPAVGFADDSVTVLVGQQVTAAFRIRPRPTPVLPSSQPPTDNQAVVPVLGPAAAGTPAAAPAPAPASSSTPRTIGPPPPQ
jgi:hypothetical protein